MRIAQVAPLFESVPPKLYGGTERVVSWLTEELVRMGHDVTLFASGDSQTSARLISATSQALRLNDQIVDEFPYILLELELVKQHAREFDFVHWHVDYMSFPISRCISTPQVTTLHGRLDLPDLPPLYEEFRDIPVISISNAQRQPLSWINWQGTVAHGLPKDLLSPHYARGEYLAVVGRISPEKGVDTAIEIAKRAGMPLRIAAKISKPDRPYYEEVIKPLMDHPLIAFVGEINEKEKDDFIGNAYAVLFPIQWPEPFGIVMIEAMACGTPVIAFPGGSVEEVQENGVTGYIVNSVEEAVRAVEQVPRLERRRVRQAFEERFTATRMARDYVALYHRMMHEPLSIPPHHFHTARTSHGKGREGLHSPLPRSSGVRAPPTRSDLQNGG